MENDRIDLDCAEILNTPYGDHLGVLTLKRPPRSLPQSRRRGHLKLGLGLSRFMVPPTLVLALWG